MTRFAGFWAVSALSMFISFTTSDARAQVVAGDVVCNSCVGTTDIQDKSVKKRDLAAGAVGNAKIRDGAVTLDKLSADVADAVQGNAATATVDCGLGESIQAAVDAVVSGQATTIFVQGGCTEDVLVAKDDVTLSGNPFGDICDKANPGGVGAINGSVTFDGVRGGIEFLTVTGFGFGIDITNRADIDLTCNEISNNAESGVSVVRASNAVLRDNRLSGNGTRETNPFIFFDCGLFAGNASSVDSRGNTYADNQYCAIEIDRQSAFRNGAFLPRETGHPANPDERDVIVEKGCDPGTGTGCFTTDGGPVAVEVFNGGLVDMRNVDLSGEIETSTLSSFRVDGDAIVQGNIFDGLGSVVGIRNRFPLFGDRSVSFTGTLTCSGNGSTFGEVQCGQTCSGLDGSGNLICAP